MKKILSGAFLEGTTGCSTFEEMKIALQRLSLNVDSCDAIDDGTSESQILLSYCWRSLKESCCLLTSLALRFSKPPSLSSISPIGDSSDATGLLPENYLSRAAQWFIDLLLTTRHWGAITSIGECLTSICRELLSSTSASLNRLPYEWLNEVIDRIETSDEFMGTRRSAGLPFCILSLVVSESESVDTSSLLDLAMNRLFMLAENLSDKPEHDELHLIALNSPRIHVRNILRALFKDARMGSLVLPYISRGLNLAFLGLVSTNWPICNSSIMLYASLINRIFGVKKVKDDQALINAITPRELFSRFPHLKNQLYSLLDEAIQNSQHFDHPLIYHILILLARLRPSLESSSEHISDMSMFIPLVRQCGHSTSCKIREMAARALPPLILATNMLPFVDGIFIERTSLKQRQNHLHGILLQARSLLRWALHPSQDNLSIRRDFLTRTVPLLLSSSWIAHEQSNPCPLTRQLYLEIIDEFIVIADHCNASAQEQIDMGKHKRKSNFLLPKPVFSSSICVSCRLVSQNSGFRQLHRTAIKHVIQSLPWIFDVASWLDGRTSLSEPGSQLVRASLCRLSIHLMLFRLDDELTKEFSNSLNLFVHHPEYEVRQSCLKTLRSIHRRNPSIKN